MDPFTLQMLQLAIFTLVASSIVAATAALAATISTRPNNNDNSNSDQSHPTREQPLDPAVQSNLPLVVWAAANALASYYPEATPNAGLPTQPDTVVINGITLDAQPGAWPTPILPAPSSPETTVATSESSSPTRSNSPTRTRRPTSRTGTTPTRTTTSSPTVTSTPSSTSSITSTSSSSMSTPSTAASEHRLGPHHENVDKAVAAAIGTFLVLIAFSLMAIIFYMLWRRKSSTGSYFKPVRYSLASTQADRMRGGSWVNLEASPHQESEKEQPPTEEAALVDQELHEEEGAPAPIVPTHRVSTIRAVEATPPDYGAYTPSRRSVEVLRSRRLVSSRSRDNVDSAELEGDRIAATELDSSPSVQALSRLSSKLWSARSSDGDLTPRAASPRPLVVMQSPTTSSSDAFQSRTDSSHGESRDGLAPMITAPMPSYRDRRPVDLKLPTAQSRFRDKRLAPMVHFSEDSTPGISPLIQGPSRSQSPRTPSPLYREPSPIVHYPSFVEVSEFDFMGDGSTPPPAHRRGITPSPEYGDDGWRRNGDTTFGRYELG